MRPILGIDTSGTLGSVALRIPESPGDDLVTTFGKGLIHGVALAPSCMDLLDRAGLGPRELGLVAVGIGPGSYTGVRVGVSFAKTLAFAAGVPVVGVPSLLAMAAAAPTGRTVVCARDARRESLYLAVYRTEGPVPREILPLTLAHLDDVPRHLPRNALVVGDALAGHAHILSGEERTAGDEQLWHSPAGQVAALGGIRFREQGADDPHELAPLYLRASEPEERMRESAG